MHLDKYGVGGTTISRFFRRVLRLPFVLKPAERWTVFGLLVVIVGSIVLNNWGAGNVRAAYGGTYSEGFVGEPRFINPILATSDIDTSISKLVYSGLVKLDANGNVQPDLASSWESSDSGKSYTVHLINNAQWHDGQKFSAKDVAYTIGLIQDQTIKSSLYDSWKDISVATLDDQTVKFTLPAASSVFPWKMTVGMLPQHLGRGSITSSFVGTGPYKYSKVRMNKDKVETIILTRNNKWYSSSAYIDVVEFWFYGSQNDANTAFKNQKVQAIISADAASSSSKKYCLPLSQRLSLFLNSQSSAFSDIKVRQKLLQTTDTFSPTLNITLVIDKDSSDNSKHEIIEEGWIKRGVNITEKAESLDSIKSNIVPKHTYDAIIVPIEFGPQVDPYPYWHSSQDAAGLNFARVKDNDLDKLIVDQRKTTDLTARAGILDQIDKSIDGLAVFEVVDDNSTCYLVGKSVHVIETKTGMKSADMLNTFDQWYIKTRR